MAPNDRQERRRMRERGAGITRDLKNTNFAFSFGANASNPPLPSRKTPQPSARRSVSRKTPASSRPRSARSTPATTSVNEAQSIQADPSNSQSSRRASGSALGTEQSTRPRKHSSKTPHRDTHEPSATPAGSRKRKRDGASAVVVEDEQDELEQEDIMEGITGRRSWGEEMPARRRQQSLGDITEVAAGEDELETADSQFDVSQTKRLSLGAEKPLDLAVPERAQEPESSRNLDQSAGAIPVEPTKTPVADRHTKRKSMGMVDPEQEEVGKENETHSTFIRRMYKPRQPLMSKDEPSKHRRAPKPPVFDLSSADIEPFAEEPSSVAINEPGMLDFEIDPSLEDLTANNSTLSQSRPLSTTRLELPHSTPLFITPGQNTQHRLGGEQDPSPLRGRKRRRTGSLTAQEVEGRPVKRTKDRHSKKPKKHAQQNVPSARAETEASRGSATGEVEHEREGQRSVAATATVPITVYRLSKLPALDDDDDELNGADEATQSARLPAVNPVDVLTQIATEVVEHMAETAHRLPSTSTSKRPINQTSNRKPDSTEIKRKRAILHHFKQSLSDGLFDITTALDAGNALSSRLKMLTKDKIQLREELLSIRQQRETVALQIDRVRREHAAWREKTTNRDQLSADLWDLEMAVKSGREECSRRQQIGQEVEEPSMGLKQLAVVMADAVGGSNNSGGICGRVEHLNGMFEQVAKSLEGRAA